MAYVYACELYLDPGSHTWSTIRNNHPDSSENYPDDLSGRLTETARHKFSLLVEDNRFFTNITSIDSSGKMATA